jgi:hypothetical protein
MMNSIEEKMAVGRAIDCMSRVADAVERIEKAVSDKPKVDALRYEQWKSVAIKLASLYEERGKDLELTEDEISALVFVAKLSKAD